MASPVSIRKHEQHSQRQKSEIISEITSEIFEIVKIENKNDSLSLILYHTSHYHARIIILRIRVTVP